MNRLSRRAPGIWITKTWAAVTRAAIEGPVTSMVTASALQLHPNTVAILDKDAASHLELEDFYRWQQDNWGLVADKL